MVFGLVTRVSAQASCIRRVYVYGFGPGILISTVGTM